MRRFNWICVATIIAATSVTNSVQENAASSSEEFEENPFWNYYLTGYPSQRNLNLPSKRVLPYIIHKRAPYIPVHKRMMMSEDIGREEIARLLDRYNPRSLRMIPLIH